MPTEDNSVTKKLLSPSSDKVHFENEMGTSSIQPEADLRLHDVVYDHEDVDEIQELLDENPDLVFEKDNEMRTPLHTLAISGDDDGVEIAKMLLGVAEGSDGEVKDVERKEILEISDSKGYTPLHYCGRNWLPDLTEAFLKYGANPLAKDLLGNSPLHYICEGDTPNAIECAKLVLANDYDGSLINAKNEDDHTPLHRAVKEQAVEMVKLLLKKEHKLKIPQCTSKRGQTILHYLCQESGQTEKSCEIFAAILSNSDSPLFNLEDEGGRTPLHISTIRRLPKITEMLNSEESMNVLKVDKRKRTALHYAAENGAYPNGSSCVESLLSRKFKSAEVNKLICYLYQMRDDKENSAFMYAALNCPDEIVGKYLAKIPEPQFWMSETEMLLVYKQCPRAIKSLMDRAFSEQETPVNIKQESRQDEKQDAIMVDFGPITGYKDPIEQLHQQETKYLKNALWWDFITQKEILTHPLVQLYVAKKCQKLRPMIYGWIVWQVIWLAAYTTLIYSVYTKDLPFTILTYISALIFLIYITISLVNEIFEGLTVGITYIISWSNAFQLTQIFLGVVTIWPVLTSNSEPTTFCRNCAAAGILLAHILSMRDFGKLHEKIGLVIEILKQVVFEILKVLLCCFMLVLGFTHSFKVIFLDEESLKTSFPGPLMTGEFEYNDTFKKENGAGEVEDDTTKLVLFLLFLICIPVAFFSLLQAFALDRVMELRERAKVGRVAKHLEHIYFIETILLSLNLVNKLFSPKVVVDWLRKHNVTTARIDGELQFEFLLKEETHKNIDRRTAKQRKLDFYRGVKTVFGSDIDQNVRSEIFALASENSAEIRRRRQQTLSTSSRN
ncbi:transient receptor potential channel pyrexia isoform X2 [Folsomia candida]|uniref:transient receptor potential channel pyrexia isoform X2 n=1 Tax=Folsomia candida TaxID=158441 RepID=UPI001605050B|nr:transient receptor potential channel pyrexia isoform X2 [Folsomia candida]